MSALVGMKAICQYMGLSESTLTQRKQQYPDFPMEKIGGVWESDQELITAWRKRQILKGGGKAEATAVEAKSARKPRRNAKKTGGNKTLSTVKTT